MRNRVFPRFRFAFVVVLLLCASRAWADPTVSFEGDSVLFHGFTPNHAIAVLGVSIDDYPELQFRRIVTRQFLLTADEMGEAAFALHPGADAEEQHRDYELDAVWTAVDTVTGGSAIARRGLAEQRTDIPDAEVLLARNEPGSITDEIRTALPVAVMVVRPGAAGGEALFNSTQLPSNTSIPLDAAGSGDLVNEMKPAKAAGAYVSRFQADDVVVVIDRETMRATVKRVQ